MQCKKIMAENLITAMAPLHERRAHFKDKPEMVKEINDYGSRKARNVAMETMQQVRTAIRMTDS